MKQAKLIILFLCFSISSVSANYSFEDIKVKVVSGDEQGAIELIKGNSDFFEDEYFVTDILCLAARYNEIKLAKHLIDFGADINSYNYSPCLTPMKCAALHGHSKMVKFLYEKGADINGEEWDHFSTLGCAMISGNLKLFEWLLKKGALVHITYSVNKVATIPYMLAILASIRLGNESFNDFVKYLYLDDSFLNKIRNTHYDVKKFLKLFKKYKIDIDVVESHKTPFFEAVCNDDRDTAKLFLEYGANVDRKDSDGTTPMHYACEFGTVKQVEMLLELGADPNAKCDHGYSPLMSVGNVALLFLGIPCKDEKADGNSSLINKVKLLVKHGARVNDSVYKGAKRYTPLMKFLERAEFDIVEYLIQNGADINRGSCDGKTLIDDLEEAIEKESNEKRKQYMQNAQEFLLKHGAKRASEL